MAGVAVAIILIVPVLPARADLLDGLSDLDDVTVEETTVVVDETADGTTDVVDALAGSTGTILDESVDDTTDLVDGLSDSATTVVGETEDSLIGVVDETEDSVTGVVDDGADSDAGETTTPSSGTTATDDPTTDGATSTVNEGSLEEHQDFVSVTESDASSVGTTSSDPSDGLESFESLAVLSAAYGLADSSVPELVDVASVADVSLYGRLLGWLTSAQSGVFGLLAGPLVALEILLRALTSAGSGLVAPLSLLSAYLFRLIRQMHVVRRAPAV